LDDQIHTFIFGDRLGETNALTGRWGAGFRQFLKGHAFGGSSSDFYFPFATLPVKNGAEIADLMA
jgi:hypothetical protein